MSCRARLALRTFVFLLEPPWNSPRVERVLRRLRSGDPSLSIVGGKIGRGTDKTTHGRTVSFVHGSSTITFEKEHGHMEDSPLLKG
jgi:hypothetical protein